MWAQVLQSPSCSPSDLLSCHRFQWDHSLFGLCGLSVSGYWAVFFSVAYRDTGRILSTRAVIETWFPKLTYWLQVIIKQDLISGVIETSRLHGPEVWLLYILLKYDQFIFFIKKGSSCNHFSVGSSVSWHYLAQSMRPGFPQA